ncbi:MAG TPA: hypothetical protein VNF47_04215 [Streptosporangiaceae bacterium]|nr:hypothetical protein [Streptosporangiaceae bacterium]
MTDSTARPTADPPPCILSYQFATVPSPLQVSGPSQASPGMVNAWISAPDGQTIFCDKIIVAVPVGTNPGEFSTVAPTLTPNTTWWVSSAAVLSDGQDLGLAPGMSYAIFTVTCPSSDYWQINYQLVFSVTTTSVNPVPDTFPYIVVEYSAPDSPDNLVQRKTTFTLSKAPVRLYLDNLVTVSASSADSTHPKTDFASGEAIKLLWESNGSTFSLYSGAAAQPVWTGSDTSYTVPGGAAEQTTFTLVATMDQLPGTVSATVGVTISNPAATPRSEQAGSLTVVQTSALTGDAQLAAAAVGGRLTVAQAARLAGVTAPTATVTGTASLASATMAAATVSGSLGGGALNGGAATAATVTVNGSLTALVPRAVSPDTTYTASSDGILTGTVWYPADAGAQCATRISGTCSSVGTVYATGGNAAPWLTQKEWAMWSNANSFALPVPQGSTFSVSVAQRFGTGAPTAFSWYPLARNATMHEVDLRPAVVPAADGPEPVTFRRPSERHQIDRVVDAFAAILGDRVTPAMRRQVTSALEAIVRHHSPASQGDPA